MDDSLENLQTHHPTSAFNPFDPTMYLGTVSQIGNAEVKIKFDHVIKAQSQQAESLAANTEVGAFLVVRVDSIAILGQLTNIETIEVTNGSVKTIAIGTVSLSNSIDLANKKIQAGVNQTPKLDCPVYIANPKLVQMVVEDRGSSEGQVSLKFATLPDKSGLELRFTPEMVLGRHCAVLGTTGSGKSWSMAKLLEEMSNYKSKIIFIDAVGEFHRMKEGVRHVYLGNDLEPAPNSTNVSLPYHELHESDLFAIFKPRGQSQAPKLRAAIKSLKLAALSPEITMDGTILKVNRSKDDYERCYKKHYRAIEAPTARFDITKLARQIENECVRPNRSALETNYWGDYNGTDQAMCVPLVNKVQDIVHSNDLSPIFAPGDSASLYQEIENFLLARKERVLCISFKHLSFSHNAREITANAIGRYLLKKARDEEFREQPLVVGMEEAHQFLNSEFSVPGISLDSFALIAKEGRKYALNLVLATQRPRDIPEAILSQMGTMFVHRLVNDLDRSVVERASSEIDRSALDLLPTLSPGEGVLIGANFPVPLHVRVSQPLIPPDSRGPDYQYFWKK